MFVKFILILKHGGGVSIFLMVFFRKNYQCNKKTLKMGIIGATSSFMKTLGLADQKEML